MARRGCGRERRSSSRGAAHAPRRCRSRRRRDSSPDLRPRVAGHLLRAHAGVAAADAQVRAGAAAARHRPRLALQPRHQRIGGVGPDGRERPLAHAARGRDATHRVRMDVAEVVDVGDVQARARCRPGPRAAPAAHRPARGSRAAPTATDRRRRRRCCRSRNPRWPPSTASCQAASNSRSSASRVAAKCASRPRWMLPRPA